MSSNLQDKLEKLAMSRTIPFCYSCYCRAPTGRCEKCHSDDLCRELPGCGMDWGVDWAIQEILEGELEAIDTDEVGEVVSKVVDGYEGGRVSRTGVASWIITQFGAALESHHIKAMRLEFLNEISLLELVLRRSKEAGQLSPELKKLLMQQMGLLDEPVRRGAKGKADIAPDPMKEAA